MGVLDNLSLALSQIASWEVLLAIFIGTAYGTLVGALPGMGTVVALVVALPFTYSMGTPAAIALLLSIYCASVYGGSITAILINTPGTPQSAATVLDGYPMARSGKADLALGWATFASAFGGVFSLIVLIIAAPQLARLSVYFGPVETFALILFALTCIAWVSSGSMVKGLLAGAIGLFLASIGPDNMTGLSRFGFGIDALAGGLSLISVLIGLFALSEAFTRAAYYVQGKPPDVAGVGFRLPPWSDIRIRLRMLVQSSAIGTAIGILPGTGATAATFVSYAEAKRTSPRRENFGKGEPDGVVASEASNNAVTGGALVPTLALGIPGDGGTVVLLGALLIQGLVPGVQLFQNNPEIMIGAFIVILIANLLMVVFGAIGARGFRRVMGLPEPLLMGWVVLMSVVGAFAVRGNPIDVVVAVLAGLFGVVMRLAGVPVAPIVIGMALGKTLEQSLRQGLMLNDGSFLAFFGQPIAVGIFVITLVFVGAPIYTAYRKGRGA
ncbi:tripartite tricarboxylate transporter permease [Pelagibius sp.]|uniref:tripartite tricarboxylate transporter permease n=1 Tax=Pelagibius sp. TaxID=1931238 RepID=UPI003BB0A786